MDKSVIVCIRSHPGPPQQVSTKDGNAVTASPSANGNLKGTDPTRTHRQWTVSITINDNQPATAVLRDPFTVDQYEAIFDRYLRDSDRPRWRLTLDQEGDTTDYQSHAEQQIATYTEHLWRQLDPVLALAPRGVSDCCLVVAEYYDTTTTHTATGSGIHCLAWELLETPTRLLPRPRLRVTRVSDFTSSRPGAVFGVPQPLAAAVRADSAASVRVLLVVARDFSRTGAERDPEPDLGQFPLMRIQRRLRSRMLLEVVRPGSREELEAHLSLRTKEGVTFHLVHFDLHGKIKKDENGRLVPWLLFAKSHNAALDKNYGVPQTNLAKAESIARLLACHKVENVVLNACLSAYNRDSPTTNLAHILLKHGIRNVSAMWYYVHWQTAATYLDTFYDELLVKGTDFHLAAQRGRAAILQKPTNRTGRAYQDFFLCVDYARDTHGASGMTREPSPTPSARSHDSSTSNGSLRAKWMSSPRLGDGLTVLPADEPMRLKLHLLELEYKLSTFRIVYASDLRRADSRLEQTLDRMVGMWLATNLVDEVYMYRGKDLGKRRVLSGMLPYYEKRPRVPGHGYLQMLFPRAVRSLRQSLHIVRDIDSVIDPGMQADELQNRRSEERRRNAEANLERLAQRVHEEDNSYVLFVGGQDLQWWRTYLEHLNGEWWLHMPWSFTVHSRYSRDMPLSHEGARRSLTPSPMRIR